MKIYERNKEICLTIHCFKWKGYALLDPISRQGQFKPKRWCVDICLKGKNIQGVSKKR